MTQEIKTYIVTGAARGIGREIALGIARRGNARIILAVRNTAAAADLQGIIETMDCVALTLPLDLESTASIVDFADRVEALGIPIDGLVNNAGVMPAKIVISAEGNELATQINYISTRMLTERLLPLMAPGGAIVFTTSMTRRIARLRPDWQEHAKTHHGVARRFVTYGRSKRMITHYAHILAEDAGERLRVNCCDPGIASTGIINMGNRLIDKLSDWFFRPLINTPAQGAEGALRALFSPQSGLIFSRSKTLTNKV